MTTIAHRWVEAGCSVIPIKADGTKRPLIGWSTAQTEAMGADTAERMWATYPHAGVAVVCGQVSGNLEMLEIEGDYATKEILDSIRVAMTGEGLANLWADLWCGYAESTPSGGLHFLYRIGDHDVPGNAKIAQDVNGKTKIETRGEGGYVIVAPTGGQCHPSGKGWMPINGSVPETIPLVSWNERERVHAILRALLHEQQPHQELVVQAPRAVLPGSGTRPGDDFNVRGDWADILTGWTVVEQRGRETLWARPGKNPREGHSASTGYADDADRLYVWSTSAGLPTEQPLSKFFVYSRLHHNGDMVAAARTLGRQGFGSSLAEAARDTDELMLGGVGVPLKEEVPLQEGSWSSRLWRYTLSDMGNADRMADYSLFGKLTMPFVYDAGRGRWHFFRDGKWQWDRGKVLVTMEIKAMCEAVHAVAEREYNAAYAIAEREAEEEAGGKVHWSKVEKLVPKPITNRLKHALKSMSAYSADCIEKFLRGYEFTVYPEMFDTEIEHINLPNGILNLVTGEFGPHDPKFMMTKMLGAEYDPEAKCPTWEAYLERVLPDPDTRDFIQRMAGYSITGEPVERVLAVLHGPGGTGKSKFIETLGEIFGDYAVTAAPSLFRSKFDASGPTNDLHDLRGARLASMSELDSGVRMDEALVKRLTGFDKITSRPLYGENSTWRPMCAIWLATNHHFRIDGDDNAIWQRLRIITFDQEIGEDERDPHIMKKFMKERSGILNWILEGLRKYRERGLKKPGQQIERAITSYRSEMDVVQQFIDQTTADGTLIAAPEQRMRVNQLYTVYLEWARAQQDRYPLGRNRFNSRLRAHGYTQHKSNVMFWEGIGVGSHGQLGSM